MPIPIEAEQAQVLIVEDNPDNLFIISDLLTGELKVPYVNARASGRQFLKLIEQKNLVPDLLLLDLQIPHEDGYTILKQIRSHMLLRDLTVIAVTANVLPANVERCRAAGFNGFIGKPIIMERFPEQIRRILRGEAVWEPC